MIVDNMCLVMLALRDSANANWAAIHLDLLDFLIKRLENSIDEDNLEFSDVEIGMITSALLDVHRVTRDKAFKSVVFDAIRQFSPAIAIQIIESQSC